MKAFNFSAGPAILPEEVFVKSNDAISSFSEDGLSILEISHRSQAFVEVLDKSTSLVKELLALPEDYEVLFLTGGASSQFYMVPMNYLNKNETAGYLDTGTWSSKAIKEANLFGNIDVIESSKDNSYKHYPKLSKETSHVKYLHLTSNNTIYGTQIKSWPDTNTRLICDMSSDIFSREVPIDKFDLIYAGAQKNMGPAGVTLVIVKKSSLGTVTRSIPTMLDYRTHIEKNSSFNTPPVFPIYVSMLTLEWIKNNGGVSVIEKKNQEKARMLYDELDRNTLFFNEVNPSDRSLMNVTFQIKRKELESEFLAYCNENNCSGLKGHRSVGGFRASIYNAMPTKGVIKLIELLQKFETKNA